MKTRITVWNEYRHERQSEEVRRIYPEGIHSAIASSLRTHDYPVRTATLDESEHGLSEVVLDDTDVLIWWGHTAHNEVKEEVVQRVVRRIWSGMGLIVLHSGHFSKVFKSLMGTSCDLKWREAGERERLWAINPAHPICTGVPEVVDLEHEEMYGEHFDVPTPDELVYVGWFQGGNVFRSGCTYRRGLGKVFYFQPGHETYPTYHDPQIQQIIRNAVEWAGQREGLKPQFGRTAMDSRFSTTSEDFVSL